MLLIVGETSLPSVQNRLFINLTTMTDNATSAAQPDYYDGSYPAELNRRVRNDLKPYIEEATEKSICYHPSIGIFE